MPEEKKNEVIKEDVETVSKKLQELTEEELEKVNGGVEIIEIGCPGMTHSAAVAEE